MSTWTSYPTSEFYVCLRENDNSFKRIILLSCCVDVYLCIAESIMEPYHRFLYTYVSLSGPHLGYLYSSNSLFNSGLWLLKTIMNTLCIHQLTFTDDMDLENTFLYKLCKVQSILLNGELILRIEHGFLTMLFILLIAISSHSWSSYIFPFVASKKRWKVLRT